MNQSINDPSSLPIGFGMSLAQHPNALSHFAQLTDQQKQQIVNEIQTSQTGGEAKARIETAIQRLEDDSAF